ncbi:DNA repair protein RecN [Sporohalobacter salinus]|uniref:DNA repair protein RecN n=1 Tax=Sporohalobacter salinus TaxID=1494606 RepID=UPI00195F92AB|nr:DNA repair protein RecN (Recombination protein N) [Sporohalobacter salinus]
MLLSLNIYNFALIEELQIDFTSDLNIITGETGAGKSIVVKALEMLLGGRASTDYIRSGQNKAIIEANCSINNNQPVKNKLKQLGIEYDSNESIILTREITHNGNNCSRINGRIVPLKATREVSQHLIEIHSQHEHQALFQTRKQLSLLDDFGGEEIDRLLEKVERLYQQLKEKKEEHSDLNQNEKEKARRIDLLQFQVNEIEEAKLTAGEDEELLAEKKRLSNAEEITKIIRKIYANLYESGFEEVAIIDQLNQFVKELNSINNFDDELKSMTEILTDATYKLQEVAYQLDDYQHQLEFNPQRLNEIEERLQLINKLKRKYGDNVNEILDYQTKIQSELDDLLASETRLEELEKEIAELKKDYFTAASKLSDLRCKVAENFTDRIISELKDLAMEKSKFEIEVIPMIDSIEDMELKQITSYGIDQIEFLISPNPGEDLKPLAKIASGGELSRTMLALKKIIAENDEVQTLIFDEVDTGIGGRVADLVAEKLAIIAKSQQVISITHLPQIASMGDTHYHISKSMTSDQTKTEVMQLKDKERIEELSRMLAGSQLTDATLEHADEMIRIARKKKAAILQDKFE